MAGENVPYHLRSNKFIERRLFIDLLSKITPFHNIKKYSYISMGGKFLEDFKLVHEHLEIKNLISIEKDCVTLGRQNFNKPLDLIHCYLGSTTDFIKDFEKHQGDLIKNDSVVLWLDFANSKGRASQLRDYETAVAKLSPYDIIKITMNCNSSTLYNSNLDDEEADDKNIAVEKIKKILGSYCPARNISAVEINDKGFANILLESVKRAGSKGMTNKMGCVLHPLAAFRYNDGYHSMVTFTSIILNKVQVEDFEHKTSLSDWEYYSKVGQIYEISVPDLSVKERMFLDERLFSIPIELLHRRMPFKLDATREHSLKSLKAYIEHYRRYPQFARVII